MNYTEETALFDCAGDTLLGILAKPEAPVETGVIVIVGGPQYRVGSHRQFVLLSRALAAAGYAVLRFDYRGMGDSTGTQRDFTDVSADVSAALDVLQKSAPSVQRVVLWGLCDGASAALIYCQQTRDPRVSGLCLLNPWVRSEASQARTQVKHYYTQRLMQPEFWAKLLRGGVAMNALAGLLRSVRVAFGVKQGSSIAISSQGGSLPFQLGMAMGWETFKGRILLLLSGDDYTAKEFLEYSSTEATWKNVMGHSQLTRHDLQGADHTFSSQGTRDLVMMLTLGWLKSSASEHPLPASVVEKAD